MLHVLKTWLEEFADILSGVKTFEFRRNDRDFQVNDTLLLEEWVPYQTKQGLIASGIYTNYRLYCLVTHIMYGGFGLPDGWCIMSIKLSKWPGDKI